MKRLWILVLVAAASRIVLQAVVLPDYAGLDEPFHVGFLAFRAQEGRSPTSIEKSMPPYVMTPIWKHPLWPVLEDRPLRESDVRPYVVRNYEAQQPGFYYAIAAPLVRLLPVRTAKRELILWRAFSVVCAMLIVVGTAIIGWRCAGVYGLLAAALLPSLPTWETLVVRASNDALACALLALAVATTMDSGGRRPPLLEGALWLGALATKLYTWPVWIVVPLYARGRRLLFVTALSAVGVLWTLFDLASRTGNPFGLFAFDAPTTTHAAVPIDYPGMGKIFVLTGAWTSGQHWNSLTPLAIKLLFVPLFVVLGLSLTNWRTHRRWLIAMGVVIVTFAAAQLVNVAGYIRLARAAGLSLPAGGKEGWYWYTLAPLFMAIPFALGMRKLGRLAILIVIWLVGWDIVIHEGALFQDFAGLTSSAHSNALFAWAPAALPFAVAATPATLALRAIHVIALFSLCRACRGISGVTARHAPAGVAGDPSLRSG